MTLQNLDAMSEKIAKTGFLSPNFFCGHLTKYGGLFSSADELTSFGKVSTKSVHRLQRKFVWKKIKKLDAKWSFSVTQTATITKLRDRKALVTRVVTHVNVFTSALESSVSNFKRTLVVQGVH